MVVQRQARLHGQVLACKRDPEVSWLGSADPEDRLLTSHREEEGASCCVSCCKGAGDQLVREEFATIVLQK